MIKKIITGSLLISASTLLNATKELKSRIIYDTEKNKLVSVIVNSQNQEEKRKCEDYIRSADGLKILQIQSKNNRGRVVLGFICNIDITEKR